MNMNAVAKQRANGPIYTSLGRSPRSTSKKTQEG
jgi:hypothetical protein